MRQTAVYIIYVLKAFIDPEGVSVDYLTKYLYEHDYNQYYRVPAFRNHIINSFIEDNKLDLDTSLVIDIEPTEYLMSKKHAVNPNNEDPKLN